MTQVQQDLETAYDILEEHGWCKGYYRQMDGKVCTKGALMSATGWGHYGSNLFDESVWSRYTHALGAITAQIPEEHRDASINKDKCPVALYNDDPHTSVEDIKLLFKRAIEAEAGK